MKVRSLHLANYAEVRDSLVYELGAYPEWWTVTELPQQFNMSLVLVLELHSDELSVEHVIQVQMTPPDGQTAIPIAEVRVNREASADHPEGGTYLQPVVFNFGIEFRVLGVHEFQVWRNGAELDRMGLAVRAATVTFTPS